MEIAKLIIQCRHLVPLPENSWILTSAYAIRLDGLMISQKGNF